MRYAVVIEKEEDKYSAYVPDLPGCVASGSTVEETEERIRKAIMFHLEGLYTAGVSPPRPESHVDYIDVAA